MTDPIDLEARLEPAFQRLAEEAEAAGASPMAVAKALVSLARNRVRMLKANAETDRAIRKNRQ
jgi:hypothetical protein